MVSNKRFTSVDPCESPRLPGEDAESRLRSLVDDLHRRFYQATGLEVITVAVDPESDDQLFPWRPHPLCANRCDETSCRRRWMEHAEELRNSGIAHWHRCECGMYCAVAPIKLDDHCVAASRLVCSGDLPQETVAAHAELLALLADCLPKRLTPDTANAATDHAVSNPLIAKSLSYLQKRLADQGLSVGSVANALDVNDTYLGHLFAKETGERMSRYITRKRIEHARHLLSTTDWTIKRIAFACGFANASWFGQRFRVEVGQSPGDYRSKRRAGEHPRA